MGVGCGPPKQTREFQLRFQRAEVIDRCPTPGVVNLALTARAGLPRVRITAIVDKQYPMPPSDVILDPNDADVLTMHHRLEGYFRGKEPLPSMAYFCLTMLEHTSRFKTHNSKRRTSKVRQTAACKYGIDPAVLNKVGDLTANKGGDVARKADGASSDLTSLELRFLEEAIKPGFPILGVFWLIGQPKRDGSIIVRSYKASQSPVYPIRDAILAVNHASCPSLSSPGSPPVG